MALVFLLMNFRISSYTFEWLLNICVLKHVIYSNISKSLHYLCIN